MFAQFLKQMKTLAGGRLMTRTDISSPGISSFVQFKNLEVTGNTFELLSSVDQTRTDRTGRLMDGRTQLEKEFHEVNE